MRAGRPRRRKYPAEPLDWAQQRGRGDQRDGEVHRERWRHADRNAVAVNHAVPERELVFQSALLERRVPPAPFERRGEAGVPELRIDLRFGLHEAHREARRAHACAASSLTPAMISPMPIHRGRVTGSLRNRCERIATTTKAILPIGKAVLTSTNWRPPE